MKISRKELSSLVGNLRDFLQTFHKASKCLQIPLPEPKIEIGSKISKDNLFPHYYKDIIEPPIGQIRLSFRFGNNNSCIFCIKKFELQGTQIIQREIVNLNHGELHHLHKNRYSVADKCDIIESNFDV